MSSVYGYYAGSHSASATLVKDGKIIYAVEEERLNRIKSGFNYESYPNMVFEKIYEKTNLHPQTCDYNIVAEPYNIDYLNHLNGAKFEYIPHHLAHNASAYFLSGFEGKVLSVSLDGGGESSYGRVYYCDNGTMNLVKKIPMNTQGSIAGLWAFVTNAIKGYDSDGVPIWRMLKDEGKLMGMAPDGKFNPTFYKILKSLVNYDNGQFYPTNTLSRTRFVIDLMRIEQNFTTEKRIQDFSFCLQLLTEEIVLKFLEDLHKDFPDVTKFCFSGGLFANVKLNQKINELPWMEEIFVSPAMGDEGLGLGCALYKSHQLGELGFPFELNNIQLGFSYTDDEVFEISKDYKVFRYHYEESKIAEDLNNGKIIGWFQGGMEFGPRALGGRSILVRPTDYSTHSALNERLNRHDTMPFAPMVMDEHFEEIFTCGKSKKSAQFMTICYSTKEEWIERIPAVIQKSDKTARPQVVSKENNPMVWSLMESYRQLSGIPVLLNTSFNIHNEPIIENPHHAFTHLENFVVDKLVIGNYVYQSRRVTNKS